jgi:hypothetical protein
VPCHIEPQRVNTLTMLVDEFLPVYDVSDAVATVVDADLAARWDALMHVDLIEVGRRRPLVAVLGALPALPDIVSHLLHGESPPQAATHLCLRDTTKIPASDGGWILLGERPRDEIALGLVGKFWRPVIAFAKVGPEGFRDFAEPRVREDDLLLIRSPSGREANAAVRCDAHGHDGRAGSWC